MSSMRPMEPTDLLLFAPVNLDPLTETYNIGFYLEYLAKWPRLCHVIESETGEIEGYILGKIEESAGYQQPSKLPYSPDTNTNPNYLPWHAHVTALTVAPASRRLGHARKLTEVLEQVADSENCWFVDLFVRADNKNAIALYKSMGYTVFRRVVEYYTDAADAFDMRKPLKRDTKRQMIRENGEDYHVDPALVWDHTKAINCKYGGRCNVWCQNEALFKWHLHNAHGFSANWIQMPPTAMAEEGVCKADVQSPPPSYWDLTNLKGDKTAPSIQATGQATQIDCAEANNHVSSALPAKEEQSSIENKKKKIKKRKKNSSQKTPQLLETAIDTLPNLNRGLTEESLAAIADKHETQQKRDNPYDQVQPAPVASQLIQHDCSSEKTGASLSTPIDTFKSMQKDSIAEDHQAPTSEDKKQQFDTGKAIEGHTQDTGDFKLQSQEETTATRLKRSNSHSAQGSIPQASGPVNGAAQSYGSSASVPLQVDGAQDNENIITPTIRHKTEPDLRCRSCKKLADGWLRAFLAVDNVKPHKEIRSRLGDGWLSSFLNLENRSSAGKSDLHEPHVPTCSCSKSFNMSHSNQATDDISQDQSPNISNNQANERREHGQPTNLPTTLGLEIQSEHSLVTNKSARTVFHEPRILGMDLDEADGETTCQTNVSCPQSRLEQQQTNEILGHLQNVQRPAEEVAEHTMNPHAEQSRNLPVPSARCHSLGSGISPLPLLEDHKPAYIAPKPLVNTRNSPLPLLEDNQQAYSAPKTSANTEFRSPPLIEDERRDSTGSEQTAVPQTDGADDKSPHAAEVAAADAQEREFSGTDSGSFDEEAEVTGEQTDEEELDDVYDDYALGWGELAELYEDPINWVPHSWEQMEFEGLES